LILARYRNVLTYLHTSSILAEKIFSEMICNVWSGMFEIPLNASYILSVHSYLQNGFGSLFMLRTGDAGKIRCQMSSTVIEKTPLQQKLDEFGHQLSKVCTQSSLYTWCNINVIVACFSGNTLVL